MKAVNYCRKKFMPTFLIFDTYRILEHCGPNIDNNLGYRSIKEYKNWLEKDPLKLYERKLLKKNIIKLKDIEIIKNKIKNKINLAFNKAEKSKLPNSKLASKYVYA